MQLKQLLMQLNELIAQVKQTVFIPPAVERLLFFISNPLAPLYAAKSANRETVHNWVKGTNAKANNGLCSSLKLGQTISHIGKKAGYGFNTNKLMQVFVIQVKEKHGI